MGWKKLEKAVKKVSGYDTVKGLWDDFTGKSAVDRQNEYNMQMWQMQNEYNTPANQMQRYLEAGLNPNLIYSQGSSGNASSAPEMIAHQGSAEKLISLLGTVLGLKGTLESQELEKVKTLSSIQHSADALNFERKRFLVDQAFRDADLKLREKEFGLRSLWKDREYGLALGKWSWERNHIDTYGTRPGTTMDWLNRLISGVSSKPTTDVASDTSNILSKMFYFGFSNLFDTFYGMRNLQKEAFKDFKGY